jgi:ribosome assembly protein 1
MPIPPEHLMRLQRSPQSIRNICILAHVDHGKTSLSDNLLASNGIISQSMQGKIRYLDSRPDEQARGITMESSAISLYFKVLSKKNGEEKPVGQEYLINLIDSPGHIDFSSEVSTASRLCDGAVVVVDVVEGVCSQTVTVLRQAWVEKMKPILVLNKFDRLVTELQLTPTEAYTHLKRLIEQINAVVGSFYAGQRMEEDMKWRERVESSTNVAGSNAEFVESSDEGLYFAPENNNVVFGSAVDGWGFNISQFAHMYERKLGMNRDKLQKFLWGDYYFDPKTKAVVTNPEGLKGKNIRPLFVQLVLETIWAVYDSCLLNKDAEKSDKIIKSLDLKIPPRDLASKDGRTLMLSIFSQWIPLSRSILLSVIDVLPSPAAAQRTRIPMILEGTPGHEDIPKKVSQAMVDCDNSGPLTAYISKVLAVNEKDIPTERKEASQDNSVDALRERSRKARELALAVSEVEQSLASTTLEDEEEDPFGEKPPADTSEEKILGFARVYSGTLKIGEEVCLLNPIYNPSNPGEHCMTVKPSGLFLLMGREMVPIEEAPAGNIVGITGLDGQILKSGSLVNLEDGGPNLASTNVSAPPILRVAVEPVDPTKIPQVEEGLRLLNMSDPCVQVYQQETGEQILATAGELHLERCIKDLKERFAKVDVHYSSPIVPYRETIMDGGEWKEDHVRGHAQITVESLSLQVQIYPLSLETTKYLSTNGDKIRGLIAANLKKGRQEVNEEEVEDGEIPTAIGAENVEYDENKINAVEDELAKLLQDEKCDYSIRDIVAFGPRRTGPNIFIDASGKIVRRVFGSDREDIDRSPYEENILTGFQFAMNKGPLCGEPLEGVCCILKSLTEDATQEGGVSASAHGRVISASREGIHHGISDWSPRLKMATYMCEIQAPAEVLGKVYGVITRRRGKVLTEEMKEGTPFFTIQASIPVAEAFGFSEEIRKRTSGSANPQLVFAGFEMLDQDPFWVPTTEEELEELGEFSDRENIALSYVQAIRKRKVSLIPTNPLFHLLTHFLLGSSHPRKTSRERRTSTYPQKIINKLPALSCNQLNGIRLFLEKGAKSVGSALHETLLGESIGLMVSFFFPKQKRAGH